MCHHTLGALSPCYAMRAMRLANYNNYTTVVAVAVAVAVGVSHMPQKPTTARALVTSSPHCFLRRMACACRIERVGFCRSADQLWPEPRQVALVVA